MRSWDMRTPVPESRLAHADGSDRHPPHGLRPHRRVRGRLPRRDRADRARRACHRPDPRRRRATTSARARSPCAARCRSRPAGVHVAVVDPGVGGPRRAVALRARGPPARRARQRPAHARRGAPRRRRGGRRPRVVAVAAGAGVGDVPRPRRVRPGGGAPGRWASRSRDAGEPLAPSELVPLALPRAAPRGRALVAHALAFDTYGNVHARRRQRRPAGRASASRSPAAGWRAGGRSATSRTASCCSTRTPPARSPWRSTGARRATSSTCGSTTRSASRDARHARACTCARPAPRTTAHASSRPAARRTARS